MEKYKPDRVASERKAAVMAYNTQPQRPHSSLSGMTPQAFEAYINQQAVTDRPRQVIWTYPAHQTGDPQQGILPF